MNVPPLEYKPDADCVAARMEAWWNGAILDRPTLQVTAPRPDRRPLPEKTHPDQRSRWMDVDFIVERAATQIANTYWAGEILPAYHPNLGPEILTAALGAPLEFGPDTSWSEPILRDWADIPTLAVQPDNPYVRCILALTERALEAGRGKFLVGITDLHPGADLAASLRDPQQLCIDLAECPEQVAALMEQLRATFYDLYNLQHELLLTAGQTLTTSWLPLFCDGRYYIPSADFSCLISPRMFNRYFLPEILEEIEWLNRSIYHLDGPDALRHLDRLLEIPRLGAIQWVPGAGDLPASRWLDVCRRIQDAGKNLHISIEAWELDAFMEHLRPEGVMLQTWAGSPEEADALVARVARWGKRS